MGIKEKAMGKLMETSGKELGKVLSSVHAQLEINNILLARLIAIQLNEDYEEEIKTKADNILEQVDKDFTPSN